MSHFKIVTILALILHILPAQSMNVPITKKLTAEIKQVIGAFPEAGSLEEQADFEKLFFFQSNRTEQDCAQAKSEADLKLSSFFAGARGPLTMKEMNRVKTRLASYYYKATYYYMAAKTLYDRPRPYMADATITPCLPFTITTSYPSGHALMAVYIAQVLANWFPEKRTQLETRAQEIAENRIIGGVHFPSDIEAGKKLGLYFFHKMQNKKLHQ